MAQAQLEDASRKRKHDDTAERGPIIFRITSSLLALANSRSSEKVKIPDYCFNFEVKQSELAQFENIMDCFLTSFIKDKSKVIRELSRMKHSYMIKVRKHRYAFMQTQDVSLFSRILSTPNFEAFEILEYELGDMDFSMSSFEIISRIVESL
jgi:hypothetical protein